MQFVISANLKCAIITGLLSTLTLGSVVVGVFYLTVNHQVDVDMLQGTLTDQRNRLDDMQAYNDNRFQETNNTILFEVGTLRNETLQKFDETNQTLYNEIDTLRHEVNRELNDLNNTLFSEIMTLRNETDHKVNNITIPPVAFEAYSSNSSSPQIWETLIFLETRVNDGESYNTTDGVFTARHTGLYLFLTQACIKSNTAYYIEIRAGSTVKGMKFYSYSNTGCFTGTLVTTMDAGETAYVRSRSNHPDDVLMDDEFTDNSFSGLLINNIYD